MATAPEAGAEIRKAALAEEIRALEADLQRLAPGPSASAEVNDSTLRLREEAYRQGHLQRPRPDVQAGPGSAAVRESAAELRVLEIERVERERAAQFDATSARLAELRREAEQLGMDLGEPARVIPLPRGRRRDTPVEEREAA